MTSPQPSKSTGWFSGRTRLITAVSIVAVGLAGATAVSANVGILDSASNSNVGNASATGDLTTPSTQVVDVYVPDTPSTTSAKAARVVGPGVQEFAVDVAGAVTVASIDGGLRLDRVMPAAGWTWKLSQTSRSELTVTMANGSRTFEFTAAATGNGNIVARVDEPIVTNAPSVPATSTATATPTTTSRSSTSTSTYGGDDEDDEDGEDGEDGDVEDGEDEDDEDDDRGSEHAHEYEGGDDDD